MIRRNTAVSRSAWGSNESPCCRRVLAISAYFMKTICSFWLNFDGFVKSPSAALRFNFVVAEGRGGSPRRPPSGHPAGCPYHRICAPCIVGASGARPTPGGPPGGPENENNGPG